MSTSTVIRGRIPEHATLRYQEESVDEVQIPYDITFKLVGNESVQIEKEIKAHKLFLASQCSVFTKMFYGAVKETKDFIQVEQTTSEAFERLLDYFYSVDIDCKDMSVSELFEIVNLAEKYNVPKFMDELKKQMTIIPLTMENMMEVATTASQFSQFEGASAALLLHCAQYLNEKVTEPRDRVEYMVAQNAEGNGVVALNLLSLAQALPPSEGTNCKNCKERDCLIGHSVPQSKLVKGLKVKANPIGLLSNFGEVPFVVISVADRTVKLLNDWTCDPLCSNYLSLHNGVPTLLYNC